MTDQLVETGTRYAAMTLERQEIERLRHARRLRETESHFRDAERELNELQRKEVRKR